jgi:poly(3-hydroxybutyrate) depolymerase
MRFATFILNRAALCLAIWLCGALSSTALGRGALSRGYYDLIDRRTFEGSTYRIRVPDVAHPNYRIPVVVILHDAGRSGAAIDDDERLIEAFAGKGYAVLAPDALPRRNARINYRGKKPDPVESGDFTLPFSYSKKKFLMTDSEGTIRALRWRTDSDWYFYNVDRVRYSRGDNARSQPIFERLGRDEIQNLRNVLRGAAEKYGIDPKPVLIIGLGHGGSLVWQIACHAPNFGQILAPVGGAFWREIPKRCNSGAHLVHTHHRASAFWPLAGAKGNKRRYARTSIYRNLEMLIRENRCGPDKTTDRNDELGVIHTTWADCPEGGPVEFMVLDKAFAFQTWWLDEMLDRIALTDTERAPEAPEVPLETGPVVKTPGVGTGFKTPGAGTGFKTPGAGTGFKAPGAGTGFKAPGAGTGSRFKRAK